MIKWLATSKMRLPEDNYKLKDAVELAERYKEDVFSYKNPNQIIEKYAGKSKEKPTDPNTVKEFAKGTVTNKKHGVTEHVVENTKEGQLAVRKVMDTHFGEKSNPWCLAQKKDGKLTKESWDRWEYYSDGPKSLVFQNGKLIYIPLSVSDAIERTKEQLKFEFETDPQLDMGMGISFEPEFEDDLDN